MSARAAIAFGLDATLVLIFAGIGRSNHGESVWGAPLTAWPFWVGTALAWWLVRARSGRWASSVGTGITVWVITVAVGMVLRWVTGAGVAISFVLVTTLVLALMLLGWRLLWPVIERVLGREPASPVP